MCKNSNLCFEYYYSIGSNKAAIQYFDKVNSHLSNLFLFNHIGLVSKFLTTKISFCVEFNKFDLISETLDSFSFLVQKDSLKNNSSFSTKSCYCVALI